MEIEVSRDWAMTPEGGAWVFDACFAALAEVDRLKTALRAIESATSEPDSWEDAGSAAYRLASSALEAACRG